MGLFLPILLYLFECRKNTFPERALLKLQNSHSVKNCQFSICSIVGTAATAVGNTFLNAGKGMGEADLII